MEILLLGHYVPIQPDDDSDLDSRGGDTIIEKTFILAGVFSGILKERKTVDGRDANNDHQIAEIFRKYEGRRICLIITDLGKWRE